MLWFGERGAGVFFPVFHSPDFDLIADWSDGSPLIMVKRLNPDKYDALFVLVGDGRRWFIPSSVVTGGNAVRLGGPKYAEYETDPGQPLPAWVAR